MHAYINAFTLRLMYIINRLFIQYSENILMHLGGADYDAHSLNVWVVQRAPYTCPLSIYTFPLVNKSINSVCARFGTRDPDTRRAPVDTVEPDGSACI
jgi:hypothetical protein